MLRELIRKEMLQGILSFKFVVILVTSVVLILLAFLAGMSRYRMEVRAYLEGQAANREQMESATDWADLGRMGLYVFRRPEFLALFSGSSTPATQSAYISIDASPRFEGDTPLIGSLPLLLGRLDFLAVVEVALSLFALLFAYDAICGEKEAGTLRMILAHPVSRAQVILGKMLGRYVILSVPLAMAFLMGLLVVVSSSKVALDGEIGARILLVFLFSLVYLLAFYLLGLVLSGLSAHSSISLILCLFAWIWLTFVTPRLGTAVAARFRPAPAYAQLQAQRIQLSRQRMLEETRETVLLYSQWQQQWALTDEAARLQAQLEFQRKLGALRRRLRDKYQRQFLKLWEDYQRRLEAQASLAAALARPSPSAAYRLLMAELTHTGQTDQAAFMTAVLNYHRRFRQVVEDMIEQTHSEMAFLSAEGNPLSGRKPDLRRLPRFVYSAAQNSGRWPWIDIAVLILDVLVLFTIAYVVFLRYDPR
ncbi:MAG: hypothetical protein D6723_17800 [Acidobacteria bacterium]|nr:MAG: hypothetical protein D6723_17800 [Acidobacteriota bacterium]